MKRKRNQLNKDMLSNLPDCVLLHIMSFLNARNAVRTCLLSKRWKYLWKHLPTLTLSSRHFRTVEGLFKFVTQILSLRDSSVLNSLDFQRLGSVEPHLLERILTYAFSHNISHLRLCCYIERIPPSLFSCSSLTSLDLRLSRTGRARFFPDSLDFPALTNLKLHNFSFYAGNNGRVEPFSTFTRLNTLLIDDCLFWNKQQPLCISSITLLNLAIDDRSYDGRYSEIELSTPNLCAFAFRGAHLVQFHGSSLSSIKQVSIEIDRGLDRGLPVGKISWCLLNNWFKEMTNIKSLTVCPRVLKALSFLSDILKPKFTFLCNLKSLKLNMDVDVDSYRRYSTMSRRDVKLELARGKPYNKIGKLRVSTWEPICLSTLDRMIKFLLQHSPSAKFVTVLPNPPKGPSNILSYFLVEKMMLSNKF